MRSIARRLAAENGFGMIELVVAMVILQVALLALLGAFGASAAGLGEAQVVNTATTLADQQLELYRAMPYDAIGLATANAPTSGTYVADTSVCPAGQSPVCGNTTPVNNTNTDTWSCTASSGSTSVSTYFSESGLNPCVAHRLVSAATSPASPDGRSYYVDTYIKYGVLVTGERATKQVSVVVRSGTSAKELVVDVGVFDCSTGNPTGAAPC